MKKATYDKVPRGEYLTDIATPEQIEELKQKEKDLSKEEFKIQIKDFLKKLDISSPENTKKIDKFVQKRDKVGKRIDQGLENLDSLLSAFDITQKKSKRPKVFDDPFGDDFKL